METHSSRPVVTVGALIENACGEALFVKTHKWKGKWGVPGGKIERGESQQAALERELLEETGLKVKEISFLLAQDCIDSNEFYKSAHMVLLNYHCKMESGNVCLNDEAEDFVWLHPDKALALDLNQPTQRLIEFYLDQRKH